MYPTIGHIAIVEISELICFTCIVKCIESIFMHKCYSLTTWLAFLLIQITLRVGKNNDAIDNREQPVKCY